MENPGDIVVESVRRVYDDGNHNAFTDLAGFHGELYLTFRSCPDGHSVFPSSRIVILHSRDGERWRLAHAFSVPDRDVRDPHLLVFQDTLFVYSGTWLADGRQELNDHQGYGVWTRDGKTWRGPRFLEGTQGHYIWRAAAYGGRAYLCGRRKHRLAPTTTREQARAITESALLASDDGWRWETVGLFQEHDGDETAFLFEEDGAVLAVVRCGNDNAQLCRARPPYRDWQRVDLGRYVGGPLLARWAGAYLVGGRRLTAGGEPRTVLYRLEGDRLEEVAELPSGGDNSYPGLVETGPGRALLSYYSSHEGSGTHEAPSAIYLAELRAPPAGHP